MQILADAPLPPPITNAPPSIIVVHLDGIKMFRSIEGTKQINELLCNHSVSTKMPLKINFLPQKTELAVESLDSLRG